MKKPSLPLLLPLLLTTFFAISHADTNTSAAPPAPAPTVTALPPTTVASASPPPPPPTVTSASPPPPLPTPTVTAVSTPAAAAWTPVADVNGETAKQVGKFAVLIYGMSKRQQLAFVSVVSGQTQPSNGGYNYRLVIAVAGPGAQAARHYNARVWGILGKTTWKLLSFTLK